MVSHHCSTLGMDGAIMTRRLRLFFDIGRNHAMGMMIIRHKVRDYGHWRPLFDRHVEMQKAAGLTNPRVYHSADSDKSEIVVVFDTKDTNSAKAFAGSDDLKKAMSEAGVLDTPTVYFLESID